jgi:hypothetical protein
MIRSAFLALMHRGDEALIELGAFLARACVAARIEAHPQIGIVGKECELGAIAGLGHFRPIVDLAKRVDFFEAFEHRLIGHLMRFDAAKKIRAALHHGNFEFGREVFLQERNVFLVELLLQRFCGRGNYDAAAAANRGKQVGERLAGSGPGLDDGVMLFGEGVVDSFGHFELRGAMFVAADHAPFEQAAGTEDVLHRWGGTAVARAGAAVLGRVRRLLAKILVVPVLAHTLIELWRRRLVFERRIDAVARYDRFGVVGLLSFS